MAFVNFATREITAKIVYYGPGLGGKTTSLQYIHTNLAPENRGKMISLATEEDRTIYFDFLPLNLGKIQDFAVRVQLYTVPGQVRYNATRKLVLRGADGLVFVADSQKHKKLANLESFNNMEENLTELSKDLRELPHILQFNKVDLPGIMTTEELNLVLNKFNVPFFETVATNGIGVLDSLKSITKLVFNDLSKKALLQKKTKPATGAPSVATEFNTMGMGPSSASVAAAPSVATVSDDSASSHSDSSPDYYAGALSEPAEALKEDSVDTSYSSNQDSYSELELEVDGAEEIEADEIQEVEPIAEFDESPSEEHRAALEPVFEDEDPLVEPEFDVSSEEPPLVEYSSVASKENDEESLAIPARRLEPPVTSTTRIPEAELDASNPAPAFTYGNLFAEERDFGTLMQNLEGQIAGHNYRGAIVTAKSAYRYLMEDLYPKHYLLDGSETSRIFGLEVKFKRFLRFRRLLDAEPDLAGLLYVHHFLCELFLSLKEL